MWDQSKALGESPLAVMQVVEAKRLSAGYGDNAVGFGIALREVLQGALDALKPNEGTPNPLERAWRPYRILTGHYVRGRSPDYLANEMGIARSTYNHEQAAALDRLLAYLSEVEEQARVGEVLIRSDQPPFLAPPQPAHGLIGRTYLLDEIAAQLLGARKLALHGLPGVGKTALAIEIAHRLEDEFEDGVLWASLGAAPDLAVQFHLWEVSTGLRESEVSQLPDLRARAIQLHSLIGEKRMLLILDDVWDEAAAGWFQVGGRNCATLYTSRSPSLAVTLSGEASIGIPELDQGSSLELLHRFVPRPGKRTADRLTELAHAVGGLPQALVIAGGALRSAAYADQPRRLQEFLDRLADPAVLQSLERAQSPVDQQSGLASDQPISLRAVIALSESALSAASSAALRNLSVFPAKPVTFDERAALVVSGGSTQQLDELVDAGMLEVMGEGRYAIHRTIADYAHAHLDTSRPAESMVTYFVNLAVANADRYWVLEAELENTLTALHLAANQSLKDAFVRGSNSLYPYLEANGLLIDADRLLSQALEYSPTDSETQLNAGRSAQRMGRLEAAEGHYRDAAKHVGDPSTVCAALLGIGAVAYEQREFAQAEASYRQGLKMAEDEQLQGREAALLTNLGILSASQGDLDAAGNNLASALSLARAEHDRSLLGPILTNLGVAAAGRDEKAQASEYFEEAIEMARADGNRRMMAFLYSNMGALAHDRGQESEAIEDFQRALDLSRELGDRQRETHILASLGAVETARRNFESAEEFLDEGLEIARVEGFQENETLLLINAAELQRELGNSQKERLLLAGAQKLAEAAGHARYMEVAAERLERA